ncbi:hypothetical protein H4R18_004608 [Coemansia javaensis]|uniref:Uncharacterized protein n=1 Tax=Coemansia javaensis TaxID=2761396 RepID=A0A9W8H8X8_9FUNG|nr:hypothetical protein H4R18_004608 [Coemansia javaensis]
MACGQRGSPAPAHTPYDRWAPMSQGRDRWALAPRGHGRREPTSDVRLLAGDIVDGSADLSGRSLVRVLPGLAAYAGDITSLRLRCNALVALPDEIGHLRRLQSLDVSYNALEELPATLAHCQGLRTLKAGSNRLRALPAAVRHLRALAVVDVSDNRLEAVPAGLRRLPGLELLDVSHNPIRTLPASLFGPGGAAEANSARRDVLVVDGCPLGSGFAGGVRRPSDVFVARFKHGVATHDPGAPPQRRRLPSLADIVVCRMANSNAAYPRALPEHVRARLGELLVCDHCHALYPPGTGVRRWRLLYRAGAVWPIEYDFCSPHWSDERERIATLFAPRRLPSAQPYHAPMVEAAGSVAAALARPASASPPPAPSKRLSLPPAPVRQSTLPVLPAVAGSLRRLLPASGRRRPQSWAPGSAAPPAAPQPPPATVWQVLEDDVPSLAELHL